MYQIRKFSLEALLVGSCLFIGSVHAELPRENIGQTTLPFPPESHRSYIIDFEFNNMVATRVVVVDPDKQKMLGMLSTGGAAPAVLSHDKKTIYTGDVYYERYVRGKRSDYLTAWDTSTLSPKWEVEIPPKRAVNLTEKYQLSMSGDDKFVYIYNFTPASSMTVVDTQAQEVVNEIDLSGCTLNYPVGDRRFASICGSGNMRLTTLNNQGEKISQQETKFFDPDEVKLMERGIGLDDTYYFTTTLGTIYSIDFSGENPEVLPKWSLLTEEEKEKDWAPGGLQVMTIAPALNRLYVLMHEDHQPHKWEDPSKTIWVFDLETKKKIGTIESPNFVWNLSATSDKKPLLLGTNIEGGLESFDLTTGEHMATMEGISDTPTLVLNH